MDSDRIGDEYQARTKYQRGAMRGGALDWSRQPSPFKKYPDAPKTSLRGVPPGGGKGVWDCLAARRSQREFTGEPISFEALSQLLWAMQGVTAEEQGYRFRTAPSAGALYPIETYLIANDVETLEPGLYHYDVEEAVLDLLDERPLGVDIARACLGQVMAARSAVTFVWTAIVERSKWKYRQRAYRYIYLDAGHIGGHLYLAATALDLGCCTIGAFFDDEVNRILGVDGIEETAVYLGTVGPLR